MSLIRDSLKKIQDKEGTPEKTMAAAPAERKTGGVLKGSRTVYALLGVGLLLVAGAVYFLLLQTGPPRSAQPQLADGVKSLPGVPPPATVAGPGVAPAGPGPVSAESRPALAKGTSTLGEAKSAGAGGGRPATLATIPPSPATVVAGPGEKETIPVKTAPSSQPLKERETAKATAAQALPPEVRKDKAAGKTEGKSGATDSPPSGRGIETDTRAQENLKKAYEQAYLWQQEGKIELAQASYRELLAQDPYNPYVLTNLGLLYQKTGRLKEAVQSYEKAVEADPRFVPAVQNLGVIWIRLGNGEEAGKWLERSLALDPDNPVTLANLGILYSKRGQREMARQYWKKSLSLDARLPETSYNLARLEEEAGNTPEAYRYYQQFIRLRNDPNDRLVQEVQRHIRDWKLPGTIP